MNKEECCFSNAQQMHIAAIYGHFPAAKSNAMNGHKPQRNVNCKRKQG